jgi:hypothetical protein
VSHLDCSEHERRKMDDAIDGRGANSWTHVITRIYMLMLVFAQVLWMVNCVPLCTMSIGGWVVNEEKSIGEMGIILATPSCSLR